MSTISDALKKAQRQRAIHGSDQLARTVAPVARPGLPLKRAEPSEVSPTPSVAGRVIAVMVVVLGVSVLAMRCGREGNAKDGTVRVKSGPHSEMQGNVAGGTGEPGTQGVVAGPVLNEGGEPTTLQAAAVVAPVPVPELVPLPPEPKLVGIFYSEKNPVAIIDGFSITEGETVSGYVVVKIQAESVILKAGGQEIVLRLR